VVDYEAEGKDRDYGTMIQTFSRFILEEFSAQGNSFPNNPWLVKLPGGASGTSPAAAPITQLCGIEAKSRIVCSHCGAVREKEGLSHVVDLLYPRKVRLIFPTS